MRSIFIILIGLMPALVFGQQFPFMEGYCINQYNLSPAYAGINNARTIFIDYRSDWTMLDGGPRTYQLSYSDKLKNRVGIGGRFIYDKTDIFKQMLILATYTYKVDLFEGHTVNFGLSAGLYKNSVDLSKYYNDPTYIQDLALIYGQRESIIKFASDISALYRHKQLEAGILFSNIMFGPVKYQDIDMTYKPFKNYLLHTSYAFDMSNRWSVKPAIILRDGENIPFQVEISPSVVWDERLWLTTIFRTGGIFGLGIGGEIVNGFVLNYSYSMSSKIALDTFNSHQVSLGFRIFKYREDLMIQD